MKITTLRKMRYEDTFIYVMQFDYVFQYLFQWGGEIYQANIIMRPHLFTRFGYRLGFIKNPFSIEQLEEGEKIVLSGAIDSIDKIISEGGRTRQFAKRKDKQIKDIELDVAQRSTEACTWRALNLEGGTYFECLTHGMTVKGEHGEQPAHAMLSPLQPEVINL